MLVFKPSPIRRHLLSIVDDFCWRLVGKLQIIRPSEVDIFETSMLVCYNWPLLTYRPAIASKMEVLR